MTNHVNAAPTLRAQQAGTTRLLPPLPLARHCRAPRPCPRRLDEAVGPDMARRLVGSLTARGRR